MFSGETHIWADACNIRTVTEMGCGCWEAQEGGIERPGSLPALVSVLTLSLAVPLVPREVWPLRLLLESSAPWPPRGALPSPCITGRWNAGDAPAKTGAWLPGARLLPHGWPPPSAVPSLRGLPCHLSGGQHLC